MPSQDQAFGRYNLRLLRTVSNMLGLQENHCSALYPLLHSEGNDVKIRHTQLLAFLKPFEGAESLAFDEKVQFAQASCKNHTYTEELGLKQEPPADQAYHISGKRFSGSAVYHERRRRYLILRDLMISLACRSLYDARTRRIMMRLASDAFEISWRNIACVEAFTASYLYEIWEARQEKEKINKGLRYAKITAAAVGGGALLALTGGLAAPAIGIGLSAMSATGAVVAGLTSTASVATLFGASGAGLVGYKMRRRTAALDQFEFRHVEPSGDKKESDLGRMAICICISGWLVEDESEYDTPFGVEPRNSDVAARLRLFYSRHNPQNIKYATLLADEFQGRESELEHECLRKYNASPFDDRNKKERDNSKSPRKYLYDSLPEAEKEEIFQLIASYDEPSVHAGTDEHTHESVRISRRARLSRGDSASCKSSSKCRSDDSSYSKSTTTLINMRHECDDNGDEVSVESQSNTENEDYLLNAEVHRIVGLQYSSTSEGLSPSKSIDRAEIDPMMLSRIDREPRCSNLPFCLSRSRQVENRKDQGEKCEVQDESQLGAKVFDALEDSECRDLSQDFSPWWLDMFPYLETFTLHWESKALSKMGSSVMDIVASFGQQAALEVLTFTAAASLVSALAWPITLLQAADMIDNSWTIACEKADRAGQLLAQILVRKERGHRPIVLIGFSMGARLIMACLSELARIHNSWEDGQNDKGQKPEVQIKASTSAVQLSPTASTPSREKTEMGSPVSGLIDTVILMGAPVSCSESSWLKARKVVAGRLVNCYSKKDWVLSLMYRYHKLVTNAAGIAPVHVCGIENVDVSELVPGHQHYATKIKDILLLVGLEDSYLKMNK